MLRKLVQSCLALSLGAATLALAAPPAAAAADYSGIRVNEVNSNLDPGDWIELVNVGDEVVDLSGVVVKDEGPTGVALAAGTSIEPGGYLVLHQGLHFSAGLGRGDSARIFEPDGETLIDGYTWPVGAHAETDGRCPDGTGEFRTGLQPTPGEANICPSPFVDLRINEVSSNPNPDFIELTNIGDAPLDISGVVIMDSDPRTDTIAAGTVIEPGELLFLGGESHPDGEAFGFGLGGADQVRIFEPGGTELIDSYAWTSHAMSDGRCPDGVGDFVTGLEPTPGEPNICPTPYAGLVINEVNSDLDPGDWIEILNTTDEEMDLSGVVIKDNVDAQTDALAEGTTLGAGEFMVLRQGTHFDFGLGKNDKARIFEPGGHALIDGYEWGDEHVATAGRCPDGTGDFVVGLTESPGAPNICPSSDPADLVKVNEIYSQGGDFIELTNIGHLPVDVSGWQLADDSEKRFLIPEGSSIAAGGFLSFLVDEGDNPLGGFGLGGGDAARVLLADGETEVDAHTYPAHAGAGRSWGRCPDGTGDFVVTEAITPGAANDCPEPELGDVRINEVESNGDAYDWVEVTNVGDEPVDISGWVVMDEGNRGTAITFPSGTMLAPGGHATVNTDDSTVPGNFGLGTPDMARLFLPDATTLVDSVSWGAHPATTLGRCPDGTGDFTTTTLPTKGAANDCGSPVRINEVESNGDTQDWIELANPSSSPVDVSGFVLKDNDDANGVVIPAGTTIPAGGHLAVDTDVDGLPGEFGLGGNDSARLFEPDGATLVDSYQWTAHATTTYGRCPDGTGDFTTTAAPSKGAVNVCAGILNPSAWPGGEATQTVDVNGYFGSDMSGLAFQAGEPDVLWAVRNGDGFIFRLVQDGAQWKPVTTEGWSNGKKLRYPDGGGTLDAEGVEVVDGAAYVATERDQTGASRPSILRHELAGTGGQLTATHEWNLRTDFPSIGANLGLEGIAFVPNSFLVEQGFHDEHRDAAYDPAAYPSQHGDGLFFVVVEDSSTQGRVFGYSLDEDGGFVQVASIDNALGAAMELEFEADAERLWVICDDGCNGRTLTLEVDQTAGESRGRFVGTAIHERPAGLPNSNHEGFAIAPDTRCVDGSKPVFWSDDNNVAGQALRAGTIDCGAAPPVKADSAVTATAPAAVETGAPVSVMVTVTSDDDRAPTGDVTLTVDGRTVTGTLDGQGEVTVEAGPFGTAGTRSIAVAYAGDEHTKPSATVVTVEIKAPVDPPQPPKPPVIQPSSGVTPGQVKIGKPGRKATKIRIGRKSAKIKVKVRVAGKGTVGQLKSKQLKVRIKGVKGKATARINKAGRLVIKLPRIAKATRPGKKTVQIRYQGKLIKKFKIRVVR